MNFIHWLRHLAWLFISNFFISLFKSATIAIMVIWIGGIVLILGISDPPKTCSKPYYVYAVTWPAWKYLADQPLLKLLRWSSELCDDERTNYQEPK